MASAARLDVQPQSRSTRQQNWCSAQLRAMALWPRLDRRALNRCGCDPARLAVYISHRTRMPVKAIETILTQ
jgi:hypothetical protein